MKASIALTRKKHGGLRLAGSTRFVILIGLAVGLFRPDRTSALPSGPVTRPQPVVSLSLKNDTSPPLHSLTPLTAKVENAQTVIVQPLPHAAAQARAAQSQGLSPDPILQTDVGGASIPLPIRNFEGISNDDNIALLGSGAVPPDPSGDVGPNHYVQWVNLSFAIWDKNGNRLYGPATGNTLWQGFGGICETNNNGDPIVLYDQLAGRWLMSQLAFNYSKPEFHQCLAISQTDDPTGGWYRYDFLISTRKLNDYPKFGVWPDAYYMAVNQFERGQWAGQGVIAFDRARMLAGQPGTMIYFDLFDLDPRLGGMLPSDLEGFTPPPLGSPNYFIQFDDNAWGYSPDQLQVWRFHVDWENPSASTFTGPQIINLSAAGLGFDSDLCNGGDAETCIDQPDSDRRLDSLSDRLMYRLTYRNFGDHETLLVNHTVDADGLGRAGIRWYELRLPNGIPVLHQAGTYSPDGDHRWMGSIAMDGVGDIALGYTVSGPTTYPSIRYTGRLAGDPPGTLWQGEATLMAGGGSQIGILSRWGDYSMMTVDPTDDCTFWYTQEYYAAHSTIQWRTRIGAFKFPACTLGPRGRLEGTVTDAATSSPLASASVAAGPNTTLTDSSGRFQFAGLPAGVYNIEVSAYGYESQNVTGVVVPDGGNLTRNFALTPLPPAVMQGNVRQGSGHGWPLYARIVVSAPNYSNTVFTNPVTGAYAVNLFQGVTYTYTVSAVSEGYHSITQTVTPQAASVMQDFTLDVDLAACFAPGHRPEYVYLEDFEADDGGFTADGATSWAWGIPVSGPGDAYSGEKVWGTNLTGNYGSGEAGYLTSPAIDLGPYAGQTLILTWRQWLETARYNDFAGVEVSRDGGATWTTVYGEISGQIDSAWTTHRVTLDPDYAVNDFRLRFGLRSGSGGFAGYYVDDIGLGVVPQASTIAYAEDFEAGDGGYTVSGSASWAWGTPTTGPGAAHSSLKAWATNLSGNYGDNEYGYLVSPVIDLSAYVGQTPVLRWWQWLTTESGFDFASVEVSRDGGTTWQSVYGSVSGSVDTAWSPHRVPLDPRYAVSNFRLRFGLRSDLAITAPGFYVDDVAVEMLPTLPPALCGLQSGGLVVGHVYDNTLRWPLNGARIRSANASTHTVSTPADEAIPDGYYSLFAPVGSQEVIASFGAVSASQTVAVSDESLIVQDFYLPVYHVILPLIMKNAE